MYSISTSYKLQVTYKSAAQTVYYQRSYTDTLRATASAQFSQIKYRKSRKRDLEKYGVTKMHTAISLIGLILIGA